MDTTSPRLRLAVAQLNFTVGAFESNARLIEHAARQARKRNAQVLILTELATCGYPPKDLLEHPSFIDASLRTLDRVARMSDDKMAILCGFPDRAPPSAVRPLHNAVAVCHKGKVLRRVYKTLLPTYDAFDEDRYFEPAPSILLQPIRLFGVKLGITICEDIWHDDRLLPGRRQQLDPAEKLVEMGAEVLINIAASPFTLGKAAERRALVADLARRYKVPVIYANQVGANDELIFDGHSLVINADGYTAARARDFAEDILVVDLDKKNRFWRVGGDMEPHNAANALEEIHRALVLGVRDALYKSGHRSALVALTGGIDSALTATLAAEALGAEQVTGVAMPSSFDLDTALSSAEALTANLGIRFRVLPVDPMFKTAIEALQPHIEGQPPDTADEDLLSRLRGTLLMGLSDKLRAPILNASNKSELAIGHCTLHGDMCGTLAVISDLPKTLVFRLAHHINNVAQLQGRTPPIPKDTLTRPPDTEPRPGKLGRDALPNYKIIDRVLELHLEELRPADLISSTEGIDLDLVRKIIGLLHRGELERRQAPPGLKITSRAFGVGHHFPIVSHSPDADG